MKDATRSLHEVVIRYSLYNEESTCAKDDWTKFEITVQITDERWEPITQYCDGYPDEFERCPSQDSVSISCDDLGMLEKISKAVGGRISMADPNRKTKQALWCTGHIGEILEKIIEQIGIA